MKHRSRWSRREFVQLAGSSLGAMSYGAPLLARATRADRRVAPRFAYVGFGGEGAKDEGIAVFDLRGGRWKPAGVVASVAPSSLALDVSERFLYAVNEVHEYEGLPSGTVEAYAIDTADGSLKLVNRQKLSLSATAPRHAAVSPDGRALVVAVHGGGAYNVLPLGNDGSVGAVSGILKETGSGPHDEQRSAHPQMVVFDRAGRVVSADLGSDRLSVLKLDAARLSIAGRYAAQAGDGPRQIAFHPDGRLLFVANELDASVACYGYDAEEGRIVERLGQVATACDGNAGGVVMAVDPAGEFLYTAHRRGSDGVSMWRVARSTGGLQRLQVVDESGPRLHEMTMTADGTSLIGLSREVGVVFGWRVANGRISRRVRLTTLASPMSVAAKSL
ncbi:MAG: 6-phosphogluconolactonase, partial [Acidobacteriaceae bacterium]|nr:6-phosphogluconolactonase [Acidobacteriaceae bacterium]